MFCRACRRGVATRGHITVAPWGAGCRRVRTRFFGRCTNAPEEYEDSAQQSNCPPQLVLGVARGYPVLEVVSDCPHSLQKLEFSVGHWDLVPAESCTETRHERRQVHHVDHVADSFPLNRTEAIWNFSLQLVLLHAREQTLELGALGTQLHPLP